MKEFVRCELACLPHAYLTLDLRTNRIAANFQGITIYFFNTKWKFRVFVRATDLFLDKHSACIIAKSYGNLIEKFKLT